MCNDEREFIRNILGRELDALDRKRHELEMLLDKYTDEEDVVEETMQDKYFQAMASEFNVEQEVASTDEDGTLFTVKYVGQDGAGVVRIELEDNSVYDLITEEMKSKLAKAVGEATVELIEEIREEIKRREE